ncbi:MAG: DUF3794 domain-containing protein [Oscillospiraceae bacterium]|nr:DUF3794 domain-containing protein [Oscillospiraceae bacterium]
MKLQFQQKPVQILSSILQEIQTSEQTQDVKIGEGMPDIRRVISAWGQPILRGKEWHAEEISASCGMMVWILYEAEGEQNLQVINTWVPFQIRWELPDVTADGMIRIQCVPKLVDARSVSPRKMMVRCVMSVLAEAYVPETVMQYLPEGEQEELQLLQNRYPVNLRKWASEKSFLLDESLRLPESAPAMEKLIYVKVDPQVKECRVLTDKLVMRGMGKVHILYQSNSGQVHAHDFEIPFSQYDQLEQTYGKEAKANIRISITNLEPEVQQDGTLRLKAGAVAQYVISDQVIIDVVEDAYSLKQELVIQHEPLEVSALAETAGDSISMEHTFPLQTGNVADICVLQDFPRQKWVDEKMELHYPGTVQLLYYEQKDELHSVSGQWNQKQMINTAENVNLHVFMHPSDPQVMQGGDCVVVRMDIPMEREAQITQHFSMIRDIQPGQERPVDKQQPSVILQRMGKESLWDIAKKNRTTIDAIMKANELKDGPEPGQILLIPAV